MTIKPLFCYFWMPVFELGAVLVAGLMNIWYALISQQLNSLTTINKTVS